MFEMQVAIKLIQPEKLTPAALERFEAERRILASLDHPNIARLMPVNPTTANLPFLVMEYVDGVPLDHLGIEIFPYGRKLKYSTKFSML